MTVTDEDRKAARAVWIQAAFDYGGQSIPGEGEERAARVIADFIADTRQAAYAAGLERAANHDAAAKVLYQYACNMAVGLARAGDLEGYKESLWFKMANAIADAMPDAIRAEKDKL